MTVIDFIEIAPMRNLSQFEGDASREIITIRPIEPGETPDLWTVLARLKDGRSAVLADKSRRERAVAFARRIRRKIRRAEEAAGRTFTSIAINER